MKRLTFILAAALACATAAQAKPAQFFKKAEEGRVYGGTEPAGAIQRWRDQDCKSTFELAVPGQAKTSWTIDWKKVFNARISTRTSFEADILARRYDTQRGIVVVGRGAFASPLPDKTIKAIDNFEFFIADQTKVEALLADMQATQRACG